MTEAYDGRQVVGIDLHRRRSVIVRMTEDGRKLETVRIANSPAALRAVIAKAGKNPRVVVEATYDWYWAADVLEKAGAEVHAQEHGLPSLKLLTIIGVVGLAAGWLNSRILTGANEATTIFRHSAWYTVWSALGALAVALYLILGCITLRWLWRLSCEEGGGRPACVRRILKPLFGYAIYGLAVGVISAYLSELVSPRGAAAPLAHFSLRVNLFVTAAVVGSVPSAVSLWITRRRARSLPLRYIGALPHGFEQFRVFRERNQRSLSVLSTIVAMAVFQGCIFSTGMNIS